MAEMFRDLTAEEIECRVAQATQKGVSLLLYKDARCDQNILDETVGAMNWMRHHCRDNANCIVSIWDEKKQMWVDKEDTGTESNTEKEKGLASDSFKRACFNWGIGRELYTAPFIWIPAAKCEKLEKDEKSGKWKCNDKFEVKCIEIRNKCIVGINICNASGTVIYTFGECAPTPAAPFKRADTIPEEQTHFCEDCTLPIRPFRKSDGTLISPAEWAANTKALYDRQLCRDCQKKAEEQRTGGKK